MLWFLVSTKKKKELPLNPLCEFFFFFFVQLIINQYFKRANQKQKVLKSQYPKLNNIMYNHRILQRNKI